MNKKQRVLDCIDNKPIDRTPYMFWHHFAGDDRVGQACVDAHKKFYDESGIDAIKMMADGYNNIKFGVDVKTPEDWKHIHIPKMTDPFVQGQLERILRLREATKDECCIFYVMLGTYNLMRGAWWQPDVLTEHRKDEASLKLMLGAMDTIGSFLAEQAQYLIKEGGLTGAHMSFAGNHAGNFSTPQEYYDWVRPQDIKMMEACNAVSDYNIIHLCAFEGFPNYLENWKDYTGAVIHWDQHADKLPICEGKAYFKNRRAIMAGFDNRAGAPIYTATKDELTELVHNYVQAGGDTGFILSSDCSVDGSIDRQRLRWIGEALENMK